MRTHGTASAYRQSPGCRCGPCTQANTDRARLERANRKARLLADPTLAPHGVEGTYSNWGCRCPGCTAAHSVVMAQRNRSSRRPA